MIQTHDTLRVTKTRRTDETSELHYSRAYEQVAICGAENQVRATSADTGIHLRSFCFTCIELKREDEE